MKQGLKLTGISVGVLIVITVLAFYFGFLGVSLDATVGKKKMDVQHENYTKNAAYVESTISDIQKRVLEYKREKDHVNKDAICTYILEQVIKIDKSEILDRDRDLYNFIKELESGSK